MSKIIHISQYSSILDRIQIYYYCTFILLYQIVLKINMEYLYCH